MPNIKVYKRYGSIDIFPETRRSGGSYCTSTKYGDGVLTITDAFDERTVIPLDLIEKVEESPY